MDAALEAAGYRTHDCGDLILIENRRRNVIVAGEVARSRSPAEGLAAYDRETHMRLAIVPLTEERFDDFVRLIHALADYEHLEPPAAAAIERLRADAFGARQRFEAALAVDGDRAVGYAIWFETYSSFLAKPTMYLEDIFVLEGSRGSGAGRMLFEHVRALGEQRGCGRMDWQVLDWNTPARDFYDRRQAQLMKEWLLYRLTY
jgi:GNAT superfamily N-acetyltransferase